MVKNLTNDRIQEIEGLALTQRQEAQEQFAFLNLPFENSTDLRYIATILIGGPVEPYPNLLVKGERLAGQLLWKGSFPQIFFEEYDPLVRQRFSIAHELGHFFLHTHDWQDNFKSPHCTHLASTSNEDEGIQENEPSSKEENNLNTDNQNEEEADAFAAAFLLPVNQLKEDIAKFGLAISFLAQRYQVAEATMRRRLKTLERLHSQ